MESCLSNIGGGRNRFGGQLRSSVKFIKKKSLASCWHEALFFVFYYILPHPCTLILRNEKRVGFLDVKGSVPLVDVRQGAIYACRIRRVNIHIQQHVGIFGTIVACPYTSPTEEETLVGWESIDVACNAFIIVHSTQCNMQSSVVSDILAEGLLAIDLLAVGMGSGCWTTISSNDGQPLTQNIIVQSMPGNSLRSWA